MKIYSTDETEHQLTSTRLSQIDKTTKHVFYVKLSDLKNIKRTGEVLAHCVQCKKERDHKGCMFDVSIASKSMRIGCTKFSGKNYESIRAAIG